MAPSSGFRPGDHVHVASFGKGVVREVRNGGRYLVELKGRSMVVTGSQITAAPNARERAASCRTPGADWPTNSRAGTRQHRSTCTG